MWGFGSGKKKDGKGGERKGSGEASKKKKSMFASIVRHKNFFTTVEETPDREFQTALASFTETERAMEKICGKCQEYVEILQAFTEASASVGTSFVHPAVSDNTVRPQRSAFVKCMMNVDKSLRTEVRKPIMESALGPMKRKIREMKKYHTAIDERAFFKKEHDHYRHKVKELESKLQATEKEESKEKVQEQLTRNQKKLDDWKMKMDSASRALMASFKHYSEARGKIVNGEFETIRHAHAKFFRDCCRFMGNIGLDGSEPTPVVPQSFADLLCGSPAVSYSASDMLSNMDSNASESEGRLRARSSGAPPLDTRIISNVSFQPTLSDLDTPQSKPLPTPPHRELRALPHVPEDTPPSSPTSTTSTPSRPPRQGSSALDLMRPPRRATPARPESTASSASSQQRRPLPPTPFDDVEDNDGPTAPQPQPPAYDTDDEEEAEAEAEAAEAEEQEEEQEEEEAVAEAVVTDDGDATPTETRRRLPTTPLNSAPLNFGETEVEADLDGGEEQRRSSEEEEGVGLSSSAMALLEADALPTATALYDYAPDQGDEDEVPLVAGATVEVVNSDNGDWWLVKLGTGHSGLVPANYLELNM